MKNITISIMAQITGISRKNLIYYDSIDLLKPEMVGDNGYRYYSFKQIEMCYVIVALKELNLPLADIKKYLEERTPEIGLNLFEKQLVQLDNDIEYMVKLKDYLEYRVRTTKECFDVALNVPLIQSNDQELFYIDQQNTLDTLAYDSMVILEFYERLLHIDAFINYGISLIYLPLDDSKPLSEDNYVRRLILRCRDFDTKQDQIIKDKGDYLVIYHQGSLDTLDFSIERMLDHATRHSLKLYDAIYIESLWDEVITRDDDSLVTKVSIRIRP